MLMMRDLESEESYNLHIMLDYDNLNQWD